MSCHENEDRLLSRRSLLKTMGLASLVLRPAPLHGWPFAFGLPAAFATEHSAFPLSDVRLTPRYPARSPLEDVLRLVPPGSDEYVTELYAFEIGTVLQQWSQTLRTSARDLSAIAKSLGPSIEASSLVPEAENTLRTGNGVSCKRRRFSSRVVPGREEFLGHIRTWLGPVSRVETAEFEITSIEEISSAPLAMRLNVRYDLVAHRNNGEREERVGTWHIEWLRDPSAEWKDRRCAAHH